MCFESDSSPPIRPIAGGALDGRETIVTPADGVPFRAFHARPVGATGAGVVILPDVRGLHHYYEELALRFAERGVPALAIDYFGRTAGLEARDDSFDHLAHVRETTFAGLRTDVAAAVDHLRRTADGPIERLYTIGFCFGGRLAFLTGTMDLGLAGVVGFYGAPTGPARNDMPRPAEVADTIAAPVLGLFGGSDPGIGPEAIDTFRAALERAGVDHRIVVYPDAPHSFFDRKADQFADASAAAWSEVLGFMGVA